MTTNYGYALHELHFVEGGEKVTVAPDSTVPLAKEILDDFVGLNAARVATNEEVSAAEARGFPGVTKTPASPSPAVTAAQAEAAAAEVAQAEQKRADAKQSEAVAAESDRNREAAKVGQQQSTKSLADAIKSLDAKNDDNWTEAGLPAVDAVKAVYGADVTRKQIEEAAPGFVRPSDDPLA